MSITCRSRRESAGVAAAAEAALSVLSVISVEVMRIEQEGLASW
jgi:hypothetical protein